MMTNRIAAVIALIALGFVALRVNGLGAVADDGKPAPVGVPNSTVAKPNTEKVEVDSLQVIVEPPNGPVQVNKSFDIRLRVVNKSDSVQSFRVMSWSWQQHWKSSNGHVAMIGLPCSANTALLETLRPNETFEKSGSMQVSEGRVGDKVSFKMGFTPIDSKRTYWSKEVTVQLGSKEGKR